MLSSSQDCSSTASSVNVMVFDEGLLEEIIGALQLDLTFNDDDYGKLYEYSDHIATTKSLKKAFYSKRIVSTCGSTGFVGKLSQGKAFVVFIIDSGKAVPKTILGKT
jgi:hypothetical protein